MERHERRLRWWQASREAFVGALGCLRRVKYPAPDVPYSDTPCRRAEAPDPFDIGGRQSADSCAPNSFGSK
jgi:hypothetical protein